MDIGIPTPPDSEDSEEKEKLKEWEESYTDISRPDKGKIEWKKTCWKYGTGRGKQKELSEKLKQDHTPEHFAYIKFYMDANKNVYALEAGKTQI